ncbi:hypothetical protein D9M72_193660 [compost metagenome]
MHEVAVRVAQHLHFDMARVAYQLFDIHLVVAERGQRLAPRRGERPLKVLLAFQHPHAASAAAPACLEHQRIADAGGQALACLQVMRQRIGCRHHRHARLDRRVARRHLVAKLAHDLGRRADPADSRVDHGLREVRVFREEAIARMNGVDLCLPGDAQDVVDVEVSRQRLLALADQIALIGLEAMQREAVFLRINRHRAHIHLGGGAHHADRDLGTVGNQQGTDRGVVHGAQGNEPAVRNRHGRVR